MKNNVVIISLCIKQLSLTAFMVEIQVKKIERICK